MNLNLIVACDMEWNIGRGSQLLFRISEDLKRFKMLTVGHPIIYGRRTLASFPKGKPLPDRPNLILSRNPGYHHAGAIVVHDLDALFAELRRINDPQPFVIGGGEIFRQLLPYCHTAYVTRAFSFFLADVHFPNLDRRLEWKLVEQGMPRRENDLAFRYDRYENSAPWPLPIAKPASRIERADLSAAPEQAVGVVFAPEAPATTDGLAE